MKFRLPSIIPILQKRILQKGKRDPTGFTDHSPEIITHMFLTIPIKNLWKTVYNFRAVVSGLEGRLRHAMGKATRVFQGNSTEVFHVGNSIPVCLE